MTNAGQTKFPTPFAAFVEARRLESFVDDPNLLPAFASSSIKVLPYQIAAARPDLLLKRNIKIVIGKATSF